jgi:hypothetical protein
LLKLAQERRQGLSGNGPGVLKRPGPIDGAGGRGLVDQLLQPLLALVAVVEVLLKLRAVGCVQVLVEQALKLPWG